MLVLLISNVAYYSASYLTTAAIKIPKIRILALAELLVPYSIVLLIRLYISISRITLAIASDSIRITLFGRAEVEELRETIIIS